MGLPDEVDGPVRKRPRLALRTSRKSEPLESMSYSNDSTPYKSEDTFPSNVSSKTTAPNEYATVTADLPSSSDPLVPPVASLYNLGNTCFMNSILEVLRYTPGFLEGMEKLNAEIEEESEEEPSNDVQLVWQVVRSTHRLYSDMESREKQYVKVATCDGSSMAVKPTALLDKIRELNPMFEGHYQHDAQELLRCLLCFIEDAHKGLLAIREKRREKVEVKREENSGLNEDPPKCDAESQHSCLAAASLKAEPESGLVLKGGSTDSHSEAKTRAQSKKLMSGESRNLMDTYFSVGRQGPTSPAGICSSARVSSAEEAMKGDRTTPHVISSRKRKRPRSKPKSTVQTSDHCPQIHATSKMGAEFESVPLSISHSPCRIKHPGHTAATKECYSSVSEAKPGSLYMLSENPSGSKSDPEELPAPLTSDIARIDETCHNNPSKEKVHNDSNQGEVAPGSDCVDSADINSDLIVKEEDVMDFLSNDYKAPHPAVSTHHSSNSAYDADFVEDILDAQDVELANIDLTIESVTKNYCSSLPESPCKSPSAPSPVMFYPGPTELIVVSPDRKAVYDGGDCSNFYASGKEAHVILHSPFKPPATSTCALSDEPVCEEPKTEHENYCVKKLFPLLGTELPGPTVSLLEDATAACSILKRTISSSSLPASSDTQLASTCQQMTPTCEGKMESVPCTPSVTVKSNIPPTRELKMQLKKCDWLGVSPVKSVSAKMAISALSKSHIPNSRTVKRNAFSDEITVNKLPTSMQMASHSTRKSARKKTASTKNVAGNKKERTSCPPGVLLKPLSIHLDKCDWMLTTLNHTVDAHKAMLKLQGNGVHKHPLKPERTNKALLSHSEAIRGRKLMQFSGTLVEYLFGGTMMHRTKCLECELAKERQEVFMDVSVPIKSLQTSDVDSDDDDEDGKDSCLDKLMLAFSNIERLKENNKYFCEECNHYVEAERSCHYTTLPLVLTLHLKRFSSNKGLMGGVSKLNDKVIISQHLPCLHYMCKQNCQDLSHRYSLYGIVTHSGSILSGHYRAYVKVQKSVNPAVFACLRKGSYRTDPDLASDDFSCSDPAPEPKGEKSLQSGKDLMLDTDYCRKSLGLVGNAVAPPDCQNVQESTYGPEKDWSSGPSSVWLECDDECMRVMEEKDFMSRLEEGDGRAVLGTPYILFYHSLTMV